MGGYLMSSMTKEGIIYARVSSHKQVTDGNGLSSQISACRAFAKKENIEVLMILHLYVLFVKMVNIAIILDLLNV